MVPGMELAWNLCESVKGGIVVIRPCLPEDAEAQRGEVTCLRTHRRVVVSEPSGQCQTASPQSSLPWPHTLLGEPGFYIHSGPVG